MTRPEEVIGRVLLDRCTHVGEPSTAVPFGCEPCDRTMRLIIEAIRAMSPDEQAELIGGSVDSNARAASGNRWQALPQTASRVAGPWVEVSDV